MLLVLLCITSPSVHAAPQLVDIAAYGRYLLWNNSDGNGAVCLAANNGSSTSPPSYSYYTYGPYPGWSARTLAVGGDNTPRILWTKTDGSAALWRVDSSGGFTQTSYGPYPGWTARSLAIGGDGVPRIMWTSTDGTMSLWSIDTQGGFTQQNFGPYSGYSASGIAVNGNNTPRVLWTKTDGSISLWNGLSGAAGHSHTEYGPYPGYTPLSLAAQGNGATLLWNHPSDSTISLWSLPPDGGLTYQNYTNPAGTSPVGLSADPLGGGGYTTVLYGQPDGTAQISSVSGTSRLPSSTVAPPGASTGGGGNGTGNGGGTGTATPNPHGHYSVVYEYDPGSSSSTDGAAGISAATKSYDNSYGDTVESARVQFNNYQSGAASAHFYGTFTAKFTWHGDADHPNSPAPAQVTVIKRSTASWATAFYSNFSGTCDTRLGQYHGAGATAGSNDSVTGYASEVKGGATFDVSCAPVIDVYGTGGGSGAYAYATASFTASAVFMNLAGTTPDSKGIDNMLIGQVCRPTLKGIPYDQYGKPSVGTITYAWKASGTRYKSWDVTYTAGTKAVAANPPTPAVPAVPPTSTSTKPSPLPATITDAMPTWYWNESIKSPLTKIETVTCTATVTPPPGQGAAFTLTFPAQSVVVQVPDWSANGHGGNMQVNASNPVYGGYGLYAGPKPGAGEVAGMVWRATVDPPPNTSLGAGSLILVQTTNPHVTYTTKDASGKVSEYDWLPNDHTGLDTSVAYPWVIFPPNGTYYSTRDSPGIPVSASTASATVNDHFDDYLMYIAPGSTQAQAVPLAHFVWDTKANNVIKPSTPGGWADYGTGPAGTVTISTGLAPGATPLPGDPEQLFEEWHEYPTWTQVVDVGYTSYILKTAP